MDYGCPCLGASRIIATPHKSKTLSDGLDRLARSRWPASVGVAGLQQLSGGASQELWRFDLLEGGAATPLILRRSPGERRLSSAALRLDVEAALLIGASRCGVPVPTVRHVLTPEDDLGDGFVMSFVEGETLGGRIVKSDAFAQTRETLAFQCGRVLAGVHAIPVDDFPMLPRSSPAELLASWRDGYRESGPPRAVFELAFRRLDATCPPPCERPRLVHGDFRNGNLMIGPEGLRAVLDWELAHVGDPLEDLGWICVNAWRFGRIDRPVGGFGMREDLYAGYAAGGGGTVDPSATAWWELFGTMRWGVMCAGMARAFRTDDPSIERAVIARRTSETEIDLMRLLDA